MNEVNMNKKDTKPAKDLKADLEIMYMDEYLRGKGYSRQELATLPEQETTRLMIEASQYVSLKLEELESRARLLTEIHAVTDFS